MGLPKPQSGENNGPNPLNIAQKAIILHTLGVQVGPLEEGAVRRDALGF